MNRRSAVELQSNRRPIAVVTTAQNAQNGWSLPWLFSSKQNSQGGEQTERHVDLMQ